MAGFLHKCAPYDGGDCQQKIAALDDFPPSLHFSAVNLRLSAMVEASAAADATVAADAGVAVPCPKTAFPLFQRTSDCFSLVVVVT